MLRWRLLLGTLVIAALVALCWLDAGAPRPGLWLLPIAIILTVLATKEVLDLLAAAGMQPMPWVVYLANLLVVVSPWITNGKGLLPLQIAKAAPDLAAPVLLAIFLVELGRYRKPGGNTANIAAGIFAVVYIGIMLQLAVALRMAWGVGALASWIIVVKMGDTGAYAVGRLIGRHKMAPLISPGKTIEGAVGALAFSCLGAWLAFRWLVPLTVPESLPRGPWWGWIAFGLLVGTAGMAGDLAESLLKRDVGVKDSSTWLPGFGGVLDIIDSLLLSAPVAWFCWASGMVGR
jgi:phosphatidate cytidylyltransferase